MSGPFGSTAWMANPASGFYGFEISNSLRCNDDDDAYLSITPSSASNRKTFTFSFWMKLTNIPTGASMNIIGSGANNTDDFMLGMSFDASRSCHFHVLARNSSSTVIHLETNRAFRDVSSWYHIVVAVNTTESTNTNRVKIYVNGTQETRYRFKHK